MSRAIDLEEDRRPRTPRARFEQRLGERLLADERATLEELREAGARARKHGIRLSTALWELGLVDEAPLRRLCAELLRVPAVPLQDVVQGAEQLDVLPAAEQVELRVIPFARRGPTLWIATAEPWRLALLDDLGRRAGGRSESRFLDEGPLALALEALHGVPADPRFRETPRRRRPATAAAGSEAPVEPEPELMSETQFDRLYQR